MGTPNARDPAATTPKQGRNKKNKDSLHAKGQQLTADWVARAPITSYSANFEDVILHRIFAGRSSGFYVDVGAGHPVFENDTKLLYDLGWSGINVEPNPEFYRLLEAERPRDTNFCLALSDGAEELTYYEVVGTGLSTCDAELARKAEEGGHTTVRHRMPGSTLKALLDKSAPTSIEFLKVDVEGFEERVLAGNDWGKYRPSVILLEATYPETPIRRPTTIRADLEGRGYRWRYFDGLNDFYVADEFSVAGDVFDRPPNVFDKFKLREVVEATASFEKAQQYARDLEHALAETTEKERLAFEDVQRYARDLELTLAKTNEEAASQNEKERLAFEEVQRYAQDLERVLAETKEEAAAVADQLRLQYEKLKLDFADERFDRHRLAIAANAMREELVIFNRELEKAHRDAEELVHVKILLQHATASEAQLQEAQFTNAALKERVAAADALHEALISSTSWKVTRPLRSIGYRLRRLMRTIRG